jgi:cbb3-type cytochrome oxidase subunit 3
MPGAATAEVIFIAAMMILILIISFGSVFFFFRTYNQEKRDREARKQRPDIQNPQSKIENAPSKNT